MIMNIIMNIILLKMIKFLYLIVRNVMIAKSLIIYLQIFVSKIFIRFAHPNAVSDG